MGKRGTFRRRFLHKVANAYEDQRTIIAKKVNLHLLRIEII